MSKKLVKILSVCACVFLIPLIILGVALSVVNNRPVTLSIFDGGDAVVSGTNSQVGIYVENKLQSSNKITLKQGTTVTITWEGEGFDFVGWFSGNESETQGQTAISKDKAYKFQVKDNTTLTALKKYVVYRMNVRLNKVSSQVDSLTFKRETGFDTYTQTREGYTLKGFEFDGSLYTPNGNDYSNGGALLSSKLYDSANHTIDVTAVWETEYQTMNLKLDAYMEDDYVYGVSGSQEVELHDKNMTLAIKDEVSTNSNVTNVDLSDKIYDKLFGEYDKFIIKDGRDSEVKVKWVVKVLVNNSVSESYNISISENTTIKQFIDYIETARSTQVAQSKLSENDNLRLVFDFELI